MGRAFGGSGARDANAASPRWFAAAGQGRPAREPPQGTAVPEAPGPSPEPAPARPRAPIPPCGGSCRSASRVPAARGRGRHGSGRWPAPVRRRHPVRAIEPPRNVFPPLRRRLEMSIRAIDVVEIPLGNSPGRAALDQMEGGAAAAPAGCRARRKHGAVHDLAAFHQLVLFGVRFSASACWWALPASAAAPLMTPLLVLLFGFHPSTAVGTDLLYAGLTKSGGTVVHGPEQDGRLAHRRAPGGRKPARNGRDPGRPLLRRHRAARGTGATSTPCSAWR